jgi:hypothetical protein
MVLWRSRGLALERRYDFGGPGSDWAVIAQSPEVKTTIQNNIPTTLIRSVCEIKETPE